MAQIGENLLCKQAEIQSKLLLWLRFRISDPAKCALACAVGSLLLVAPIFAPRTSGSEVTGKLAGIVKSQNGNAIASAHVELRQGTNSHLQTVPTGVNGRFLLRQVVAGDYTLTVSALGFEPFKQSVTILAGATVEVAVTLKLLPVEQTVVVTSTQTPEQLTGVPAQVTVLNSANVNQSPAITLDDLLREVPSFSLFRRTSSLVAQPTTEGVSLRGIGASGVSRTLVFLDGVPINDPVGSWIYWAEVPAIQVRDIEIAPGGVSSLYGSSAMAGVIDIRTRRPKTPTLDVNGFGGFDGTGNLDYLAGSAKGRFSYNSAGSFFRTDGYVLVPEPFRGAVDIAANSRHETANARMDFQATRNTILFIDGRFYNENRGNGTPLQNNSMREGALNAGLRSRRGSGNEWRVNIFSFDQVFHSSFSAVAANRASETLSLLQAEPAYGYGGNAQWSRPIFVKHLLSIGGDARWTYARDQENSFSPAGTNTVNKRIPAEQALAGAFIQDFWDVSNRLNILAGARVDTWKNYAASLTQTTQSTGTTTVTSYPAVSKSIVTPHAGIVFRINHGLTARAAFYQGFRAPTLDELYRAFRVGNVLTLANPNLGPERVTGYEVGLNQQVSSNFFWRVTAFSDHLDDPISNVTISVTPSLITNQRENLGFVNVKGISADASYRFSHGFDVNAGYLFDQAVVGGFSQNPATVGNMLPQVPKHRGTLIVSYSGWWHLTASVDGRYESHRFDDVSNQFKLGSFFVLDAKISRHLGENWTPFFEVDNLLNRQYPVAAIPVPQVGTPIFVLGGVRFAWSGN